MPETKLSPIFVDAWSSVTHVSFDVSLLILLFLGFTALSFYFGKTKSINVIVSSYVSLFLFSFFPYLRDSGVEPIVTIGAFIVLLIVVSILLKSIFASDYPYSTLKRVFEASVFSISFLIILIIASYHFLPVLKFYHFSNLIAPYFTPAGYVSYWLAVPIIAIFVVTRR